VCYTTRIYTYVCPFVYVNIYAQVVLGVDEQAVDQLSFKSVLHNTHLHISVSICICEHVCADVAGNRRASSGSAEF